MPALITLSLMMASGDLSDLPGDDEDIISYWNLNEGEGQNSTNQVAGPQIQLGTSSSNEEADPSWEVGIMGSALHFDGDDDVATAADFDFPRSELTLSFWVNTSWTVEGRVPLSYANIYETNEFMLEDPGDLTVHIRGLSRDTGVAFNDGKWHHIVLTWRGQDGDLRIYKDSVPVFNGLLAVENTIRSGGTLVLGNDQDEVGGGFDPEQAFNGTMDEILIFDTILEEEDMDKLFEWTLPPPEVVEATPDGGRHPLSTMVNITFNIDMDKGSVEEAFSIEPKVNGTFYWSERSVSFVPDDNLADDTEYKIRLSTRAEDLWGRELKDDIEVKFRTIEIEDPAPSDDDDDDISDEDDEDSDNTTIVLIVLVLVAGGMIAIIIALALISRLYHKED